MVRWSCNGAERDSVEEWLGFEQCSRWWSNEPFTWAYPMLLEPPPRDRTADIIPPYSYEFSSFLFLGESAAHHEKDPQEAAAEDQGPVARVTVRACATIVWWWQISRWFLDFSIYIEIDRAPYPRRRDNLFPSTIIRSRQWSRQRLRHRSRHAVDNAIQRDTTLHHGLIVTKIKDKRERRVDREKKRKERLVEKEKKEEVVEKKEEQEGKRKERRGARDR